jgi:hypothetical protein
MKPLKFLSRPSDLPTLSAPAIKGALATGGTFIGDSILHDAISTAVYEVLEGNPADFSFLTTKTLDAPIIGTNKVIFPRAQVGSAQGRWSGIHGNGQQGLDGIEVQLQKLNEDISVTNDELAKASVAQLATFYVPAFRNLLRDIHAELAYVYSQAGLTAAQLKQWIATWATLYGYTETNGVYYNSAGVAQVTPTDLFGTTERAAWATANSLTASGTYPTQVYTTSGGATVTPPASVMGVAGLTGQAAAGWDPAGTPIFSDILANFTVTASKNVRTYCNKNFWDLGSRYLLCQPALVDGVLPTADAAVNQAAIESGNVARRFGITFLQDDLLSTNGTDLTAGVLLERGAIGMASAPVFEQAPQAYLSYQQFQVPDLKGITFTYKTWYDWNIETYKSAIQAFVGFGALNTKRIRLIKATDI